MKLSFSCLLAHSMRIGDFSVKDFSTHHGAIVIGFQFILQSILISNISIDSIFVSHAEGYSPT